MCSSASSKDSSASEPDDDAYMDPSDTLPTQDDRSAITSRLRPRPSMTASITAEQAVFTPTVPQQLMEFGSLIAGQLALTRWAQSEGFYLYVSRKISTYCYLRCFQHEDMEDPCSYQLKVEIVQGTERFGLHVIVGRHNHPPESTHGESLAAPSDLSIDAASPSSAVPASLAVQARSCGDSSNGQQGSRWQSGVVQYHVPVPQEHLGPFQTAEQAQLILTRWSIDQGYLLKSVGGFATCHYLRCNRYNTGPQPRCPYYIKLGLAKDSPGWRTNVIDDVHNHASSLLVDGKPQPPTDASITARVAQSSSASDFVPASSVPAPQSRDQQQSGSVGSVPFPAFSSNPSVTAGLKSLKVGLKRSGADSCSAAKLPTPAPLPSSTLFELRNKTSGPAQQGLSSTDVTSGPKMLPNSSCGDSDQSTGQTSNVNISVAVASSSTRMPSHQAANKTAESPQQASVTTTDQQMQTRDGTQEPSSKRARTEAADQSTSNVMPEAHAILDSSALQQDTPSNNRAVHQDGPHSCELVRAILNTPQKEFAKDILQLSELELHQYLLRNNEINRRLKKHLKK